MLVKKNPFSSKRNQKIIGYADLSKKNTEELLKSQSQLTTTRGIRQILNHHPTNSKLIWPKVERSDYLTSEDWRSNYQLLQKYNLSFDLQINPHQLKVNFFLFKKFLNINKNFN